MAASDKELLENSTDMAPVEGTVDVDVPIDVLWECFTHADLWPRWNTCMYLAINRDLVKGKQLLWAFDPIRWFYPYKLPGVANLVEVEENRHVTWEVTLLPGFFARHTYSLQDLGNGRTRFGSWEQATGPMFRLMKRFWVAHFVFVKERSLQGAHFLEQVYCGTGQLDKNTLKSRDYVPLVGPVRALLRPLDVTRIRSVEVAPGVSAVLGGGGNSLVIKDGREALLVDSKWRPFSGRLRRWIQRHAGVPVTTLVNTHFHFDHTSGNVLFPDARIIAHKTAPELMLQRDSQWWRLNPGGVPRSEDLIEGSHTLQVGEQEITIHHSGQGHTISDLWVHLRRGNADIIATGDVASLGVYPFFDLGEGGADILNMVKTLRNWVSVYPNAVFVPGHGPVATAADLAQHADYLEFLWEFVGRARAEGLTENEAVARIDLTRYRLANLPIFHYGARFLSARSNIYSVYRLQARAES